MLSHFFDCVRSLECQGNTHASPNLRGFVDEFQPLVKWTNDTEINLSILKKRNFQFSYQAKKSDSNYHPKNCFDVCVDAESTHPH